jgi:hypothetical protein
MHQVFLLSPAYCGGRRAGMLLRPEATLPLARQLQAGTLPLGSAFAFLSGLYFRGKLGYAEAFGRPLPAWPHAALVITPTRGLQPAHLPIGAETLREFAAGDVSLDCDAYRSALERDATALGRHLDRQSRVILLGSVATGKYVDILVPALGGQLYYPSAFIGRGDMSRGGLLLRSVASGIELDYEPLSYGVRPRGPRPPKLDPLTRPGSKLEP